MAYTPDYTSADITSAANDGIARGLIVGGSLAGVIVLVFILGWGYGKLKGK
jgi:hypothetical protein